MRIHQWLWGPALRRRHLLTILTGGLTSQLSEVVHRTQLREEQVPNGLRLSHCLGGQPGAQVAAEPDPRLCPGNHGALAPAADTPLSREGLKAKG